MCTVVSLKNVDGGYLVGRNMDIEYNFNQTPIMVPRKFSYLNRATKKNEETKFALLGMGTVVDNHPLFAEVQNEKGLACAALNFPDAAWQEECEQEKVNLPPYDLNLWITANFESVKEVMKNISKIALIGVPVSEKLPLPTLHWMVTDSEGDSVVIEAVNGRLNAYTNKVGVMTNAPDFGWHLTNLKNYMNISKKDIDTSSFGKYGLTALGTGTGLAGIPGDFSSVSRFVRASFLRNNLLVGKNSSINGLFHILDNVKMVEGSVITKHGYPDITIYSSCMDLKNSRYYFKTYDNQRVRFIDLLKEDLDRKEIIMYPFEEREVYKQIN